VPDDGIHRAPLALTIGPRVALPALVTWSPRGLLRDPLIPLRIVMATVLVVLVAETRVDADLWGHVLFGGPILSSGTIPSVDPYSFTSDIPWTNHEWASELVMYAAFRSGGPVGLVALRLLVVMAVFTLAVLLLRPVRRDPLLHDIALAVLLIGIHTQTVNVRPQLFSILFFAILLRRLMSAERVGMRGLWAIPILFVCWVNFHGGWIVGAGILALWCAFEAAARLRQGEPVWPVVALVIASAAGVLVNPYGIGMLRFLHQTVSFGRIDIQEWQPVYRLGWLFLAHWLFLVAFATAVIVRAPARPSLRRLILLVVLGVASFQLVRVVGFFAIACVLLVAPELEALASRRASRQAAAPARPVPIAPFWLAATVSVVVGLSRLDLGCIRMDKPDLDRTPEPDVVRLVKSNQLRGRMLIWFDWGEYAIWHLYPAIRISFDGRRETVYSARVLDLHYAFYEGRPEGLAYARALNPDYVWVPATFPVVDGLKGQGWSTLYRGPISVLLAREPPASLVMPESAAGSRRCFPSP
jgi:hypothetical protein